MGAKGVWLELDDGRRILDACAGAAVASVGHGDTRVINAVAEQMRTLSYHHTSRLTNPSAEKLAQLLLADKPGGLSKAVFLSSGSEANESAIKLARQYFVEIGALCAATTSRPKLTPLPSHASLCLFVSLFSV